MVNLMKLLESFKNKPSKTYASTNKETKRQVLVRENVTEYALGPSVNIYIVINTAF
jgi:hypothetical protein